MRAFVIAACCAASACEKESPPRVEPIAATEIPTAPKQEHTIVPIALPQKTTVPIADPEDPVPVRVPVEEPKPDPNDKFCKKHPRDYQRVCHGIGPLHIPYPPYPRARMKDEPGQLKSRFRTTESWLSSLSTEQLKYLHKMCPGGEDQPTSDLCGDNTPLVIAFGNEPVTFVANGTFDAPTAATPWLALDRDGNGTIDSAAELFGSSTKLADGQTATNGFFALAELDANHDGTIDASDPAFTRLQLWADRDRNRVGTTDELTAASASIVSISLANHVDLRCDARDNCEGERATIVWHERDASPKDGAGMHEGSIVDVYLPRR